jgi:hypothetical protein
LELTRIAARGRNSARRFVTDGLVGQPGTTTLLGGTDLDTGANPGFRLGAGYAVSERWGVEGSFLYIPTRSTGRSVSSSAQGTPSLAIPYIDANTGAESRTGLSLPGVYRGSAREELSNNLMGAELNAAWALAPAGPWRVDLLGGFRWLRLRESYTFTTSSPLIPPFPQDIWNTGDEFVTTNNFYGPQVGVRARFDWGHLFTRATLKFALGAMAQSGDVAGSFVSNDFNGFGQPQTFAGGYFALPTNIGSYWRTAFAVITSWASIFVGYTFLYTNNVVRPGNQVDRTINPTQALAINEDPASRLQGPARPSFTFNSSDFWAQGLNVGLTVRF